MGATQGLTEIRELKTEIAGLRNELKRFIEHANLQHVDGILSDLKKNYADLFTNHQIDTAKIDLSTHMVSDCKMRSKCFELFMDFLKKVSKKHNFWSILYVSLYAHVTNTILWQSKQTRK